MPSGGARTVSRPPPDPDALRRERPSDKAGWTTLPAEHWVELWRMPQAIMWERLGQRYEVAMCVRMLTRAEQARSSVELQKVVRQYFDSLGLSTQGMLRNRWRLSETADASSRPAP